MNGWVEAWFTDSAHGPTHLAWVPRVPDGDAAGGVVQCSNTKRASVRLSTQGWRGMGPAIGRPPCGRPEHQVAAAQLSSCRPGTLANSRVLLVTSRAC